MWTSVQTFFRRRWDSLRRDRAAQLIVLAALLTFPPAFYYGQMPVRALLLALLVFGLLVRSTLNSWTQLVRQRLDSTLPPPVAFYRLFLRDLDVQSLVSSARWYVNINICLLLLNNPFWIPLVDVFLGLCFFLTFSTLDELHIRGSPTPGRPVDSSGNPGGGWRSGYDYMMGHAQRNPRRAALLTLLGAALGYAGKSVMDGVVQDTVNVRETGRRSLAEVDVAKQTSKIRTAEMLEISKIHLDADAKRFQLQVDADAKRLQLQVDAESKLSRIRIDQARELSRISTVSAPGQTPGAPSAPSTSLDQPDLSGWIPSSLSFPTQL